MIRVAITEAHGVAHEASQFGPAGVEYSFIQPSGVPRFVRSPIKGYLRTFNAPNHDLIEAVIMPIVTRSRWIYSIANFQEAAAFSFLGAPIPRFARIRYIRQLLLRENCRKVILWSKAGLATLGSYAGLPQNDRLFQRTEVVYPAIRRVPDHLLASHEGPVTMLFSGDFFRKGGVNVVDAFEQVRRLHSEVRLLVCCDERIDFNTPNAELRAEYLRKLRDTPGIEVLGRLPRERLMTEVLPKTHIYLLPTYNETFGMAILEAMSYGIPVIATHHFAIPEMLSHDVTGLLIDVSAFDLESMFRGYVVNDLPAEFRASVTDQLVRRICELVESPEKRRRLGAAAIATARSKFSFDTRNARMLAIYQEALS